MSTDRIVIIILSLIKSYSEGVSNIVNMIVNPLANFLGHYSSSLGDTVRNSSSIITNILLVLPLILVSILVGSLLGQDSGVHPNEAMSIDIQLVLMSILIMASGLAFFISHFILEDRLSNTLYISSLPVVATVLIYHFSTPELYVVLLAVLYGLGGYTATKIDLKNPVDHEHVYDKLEPQNYILRVSLALIPALMPILYGAYMYESGLAYITLVLFAGLVAHIATVLQKPKFETFYTMVGLRIDSTIWILTPRLFLFLGLGGLVLSGSNVVYMVFLFAPALFGIAFYRYINSRASELFGDRLIQDSKGMHSPFAVTPNCDIDINQSQVDGDEVELDVRIKMNIDDELPDNLGMWSEALEITNNVNETVESIRRVDSEKSEKIEDFQDELVGVIIDKQEGNIKVESLPDDLSDRVIAMLAERGELDNQQITDIGLKRTNVNKRNSKMYSDKI